VLYQWLSFGWSLLALWVALKRTVFNAATTAEFQLLPSLKGMYK
jgi:hypothetical protein